MVKFKWNVPNIALFKTGERQKVFSKQSTKMLDAITSTVKTNIKFGAPVGVTGQLRDTVSSAVNTTRGRVFTQKFYGPIIEAGRKAGPVSKAGQESLARWIAKSSRGRSWFAAFKSKFPKTTIRGATYVLARSMKRKKRKPNPFFERGVKRSDKRIRFEYGVFARKLAEALLR